VKKIVLAILISISGCIGASAAELNPPFTMDLPPLQDNQEVVMLVVEYQPGHIGSPHRHNGHTFVYVMEGQIVMQVEGQPEKVLNPGDTFYENPDDIHVVGRNASNSESAKFLVFLIKTKGDPISVPQTL
jgi:quercetin dioxygenase-like cupin family protein